MGIETAVAIVSLAVAASTAAEAKKERKTQSRLRLEAQGKQEAKEEVQLAESRRQQLRQERVKRARLLQRSQNLGAGQSSGVAGAAASGVTQFGAATGFQTGQGFASQGINASLQGAADAGGRAANATASQQLASQVFSSAGGFKTIFTGAKDIFTTKKTP